MAAAPRRSYVTGSGGGGTAPDVLRARPRPQGPEMKRGSGRGLRSRAARREGGNPRRASIFGARLNAGVKVGAALPADALAHPSRLPRLLAALERRLDQRANDHDEREEAHEAEAEEGDDLVVGLPDEALAVLRERGSGQRQLGKQDGDEGHSAALRHRPRLYRAPAPISSLRRGGEAAQVPGGDSQGEPEQVRV